MDIKKEFDVRCKLMFITRNLHIYDKISVIFLICDKPYAGLKIIEILLMTESKSLQNKAFFTWAKKQMLFSNTDWREKFAEILSTIQNYRLAKYLGYNKEELIQKMTMKKKVQGTGEIKIILYRLCESLNQVQTMRLIDSVNKEYNALDVDETFKYNYLEKKILEWCVKNIISIDTNKKINLEAVIRSLEVIKADDIITELTDAIAAAEFKLLKSIKTTQLQNSLSDCYNIIDRSNLGLCLIINEKSFPGSDLKPRWGSNKDVERLKEVFTAFGFRIKIHTNLIYEKLIDLLNKYAKLISPADSCFVLIILSHGSENVIYTSDSVAVSMHTIEMIFQAENCPNLIGKPKIFIIQSCQGQKWQKLLQGSQGESESEETDIDIDAPNTSVKSKEVLVGPQKGDSIIAWSTVQGYASFRDKHNGSWYIEELCKELWKFGQFTDLVDILTLVNNNLRSKVYDGQFMVPSLLSSLSGKVQFPYVEENWLMGRQLMFKRLFFEIHFLEFLQNSNVSPLDLLKLQ